MTCWARIELDPQEVAFLDGLFNAQNAVRASLACALPDGHPGPHAAEAQASGPIEAPVEHWVRWTLRSSEITVLPECTTRSDTDEPCLLFDEHPGPHSFDR